MEDRKQSSRKRRIDSDDDDESSFVASASENLSNVQRSPNSFEYHMMHEIPEPTSVATLTSSPPLVTKPTPLFLQKLYEMVNSATNDENERKILSWSEYDDTLFVIYNLKQFEEIVLLKNKRFTSMSSFRRQLSYYGFKKVTYGPLTTHSGNKNKGTIYRQHDGLFRRGRPDLLSEMRRTSKTISTMSTTPSTVQSLLDYPQHLQHRQEQMENFRLQENVKLLSNKVDDMKNDLQLLKQDMQNDITHLRQELNLMQCQFFHRIKSSTALHTQTSEQNDARNPEEIEQHQMQQHAGPYPLYSRRHEVNPSRRPSNESWSAVQANILHDTMLDNTSTAREYETKRPPDSNNFGRL